MDYNILMQADPLPPPVVVTRFPVLQQLAETLSKEPLLAVDTESNSLYAYREQVCLIQFSTPTQDYLVDPLVLIDLSPLAPVFANPQIEKVFHAAEYDLICLKRDFDFTFANLFDTMVAARILGRKEVGLGSLLQAEFGVTLNKHYQRADWGQRPLPQDLLAYARLDTHYLIALRERLKAALHSEERWPLAVEDFNRACHVNGRIPDEMDPCSRHMSGTSELSPQQNAVLQELCLYRDQVAQAHNRPLFKVLSDATLIAVAAACPARLDELKTLPGMSSGQLRRHGKGLLMAVARGLQAPPVYPERAPRPSDAYLTRLDMLREWRKETARQWGVESDVILPRDLMFLLAERNPRQPADLAAVLQAIPWRLEHFGDQLLAVLTKSQRGLS